MSKTCYQNITPTKNRELDVFEDMSPTLRDTDCPVGDWAEDEPDIDCQNPDYTQKDCYRCDGMYRDKLSWCVPQDSEAQEDCPQGFEEKKMSCNYPHYAPPTSPTPHYPLPPRPCSCVNSQGIVDGYSIACCPQEAPPMYPPPPMYPQYPTPPPQPIQPIQYIPQQKAGILEGLPWFSWILGAGLIYWAITKYDVKIKSK